MNVGGIFVACSPVDGTSVLLALQVGEDGAN